MSLSNSTFGLGSEEAAYNALVTGLQRGQLYKASQKFRVDRVERVDDDSDSSVREW